MNCIPSFHGDIMGTLSPTEARTNCVNVPVDVTNKIWDNRYNRDIIYNRYIYIYNMINLDWYILRMGDLC